jgi:hypothetical protein
MAKSETLQTRLNGILEHLGELPMQRQMATGVGNLRLNKAAQMLSPAHSSKAGCTLVLSWLVAMGFGSQSWT